MCIDGINHNEFNNISDYISQKLKEKYDGEWFALICKKQIENFDFKIADIMKEDIFVLGYKQYEIYISKLK